MLVAEHADVVADLALVVEYLGFEFGVGLEQLLEGVAERVARGGVDGHTSRVRRLGEVREESPFHAGAGVVAVFSLSSLAAVFR